jgi:hypothetical protein
MVTNQQWVQAKSPADITLEGVSVELDWTDSTVNSILVRDANGNALRIIRGEYAGMRAMVPAKVAKYRLHGTLCGSPFEQVFDEEHEAEDRQREFDELGEKAQLTITKINVPV